MDFLTLGALALALYFQVFMLLTFLSSPARAARAREFSVNKELPKVAMIVPCYNEEQTIAGTVESLLALSYPKEKLSIILVNDGSTDGTRQAMDAFASHEQVTVVHTENRGKFEALNTGISLAKDVEFVGCLDADSFMHPQSLTHLIASFDDDRVAATTASMSVNKPKRFIEHMQNAEYILGITLRHILASVNGLYVTPGPASLYRMSVLQKLGGFRHGHQTEDMEMALRIQRAGYRIENAPKAVVYTKVPPTVLKLIKQRVRWTTGFMQNMLNEYRDMLFNPRFGLLGLLVLPMGIFAVVSGVFFFLLFIYRGLYELFTTLWLAQGVPLSHLFSFNGVDLFFLPISGILLLGSILIFMIVAFIIVGNKLSKTHAPLGLGIVGQLFLYGIIAPLWLLRSLIDILFKKNRAWR